MINDIFYGKVPGVRPPTEKKSFLETQNELNNKLKFELPKLKQSLVGGLSSKTSMSLKNIGGIPKKESINLMNKISMITGSGKMKKSNFVGSGVNFNQNKLRQFIGTSKNRGTSSIKQLTGTSKNRGMNSIKQFMNIKTNGNIQQKLFGDRDGDGVKNVLDCQPLNRSKQGMMHKLGNFMRGKGYAQSLEQDVRDADRKLIKQQRKEVKTELRQKQTSEDKALLNQAKTQMSRVLREQRMKSMGITSAKISAARGDAVQEAMIMDEQIMPQKMKWVDDRVMYEQKQRQLERLQGKLPPGLPGYIQGIRSIGQFGHRGLMGAMQTGQQLGGTPYKQRIMRALGKEEELPQQVPQPSPQQQVQYPQIQPQQIQQIPQQQMQQGGQETIEKEGVTYIRQPSGKWLNTKTGKQVNYPRGKYEGRRQYQQPIQYQQPMQQQQQLPYQY